MIQFNVTLQFVSLISDSVDFQGSCSINESHIEFLKAGIAIYWAPMLVLVIKRIKTNRILNLYFIELIFD